MVPSYKARQERETERQRDRETERQRDRETERQRDRESWWFRPWGLRMMMGAPLQKEAKAGRNLNSGRVPTQQELVYGECPPTKGSKGEKDLGFRVSALGFKGIDWRPLQGQARGKPLQ